ncbi:hypothetical protein GALL_20710 [mine drainage metagenome]|uniref:Uncharacterized protein n=1 Tax=mine drainage metagenome TaxID=410659 RepID=A0A1J5TAG9_9ZZZZ
MHLRENMAKIERPTAREAANTVLLIHIVQVTPIKAANMLPPIIDQGCAKGLEGTANNNTAEAPMGAIKYGIELVLPSIKYVSRLVSKMPVKAPMQARKRSV